MCSSIRILVFPHLRTKRWFQLGDGMKGLLAVASSAVLDATDAARGIAGAVYCAADDAAHGVVAGAVHRADAAVHGVAGAVDDAIQNAAGTVHLVAVHGADVAIRAISPVHCAANTIHQAAVHGVDTVQHVADDVIQGAADAVCCAEGASVAGAVQRVASATKGVNVHRVAYRDPLADESVLQHATRHADGVIIGGAGILQGVTDAVMDAASAVMGVANAAGAQIRATKSSADGFFAQHLDMAMDDAALTIQRQVRWRALIKSAGLTAAMNADMVSRREQRRTRWAKLKAAHKLQKCVRRRISRKSKLKTPDSQGPKLHRLSSVGMFQPKKMVRSVSMARNNATAFLEADANGDGLLSFSEFLTSFPLGVRETYSEADLRSAFDSLDVDGSGTISFDEFFLYTLAIADTSGAGLIAIFERYDTSGEGQLDAQEFEMAVEDMGYGGFGHELFLELDVDGSGHVSYGEILNLLKSRTDRISFTNKRVITAMAFNKGVDLDVSQWDWTASNTHAMRRELLNKLMMSSARVTDLYEYLTNARNGNNTNALNRALFVRGLLLAGFAGDPSVLHQVFDEIDIDRSDVVGVKELYDWMNDRLGRRAETRDLRLRDRGENATPLDEISWSPEVLRVEIQLMLITSKLAPMDLIRAWDDGGRKTGDGSLSKKEFLAMAKSLIDDENLWREGVRSVAARTYDLVSGGDASLDAVDLAKWLNAGWLERCDRTRNFSSAPAPAADASKAKLARSTGGSCGANEPSVAEHPSRQLHAPTSIYLHPLRPPRFVRSESGGCLCSSIATPKRTSKEDSTPSWMRPVVPSPTLSPTLSALSLRQRSVATLSSTTTTPLRSIPSRASLKSSATSPMLLPSPTRPIPVRSSSSLLGGQRRPHWPTRPVVGREALRLNAANDAAGMEEAAALLLAKRVLRKAASRSTPTRR